MFKKCHFPPLVISVSQICVLLVAKKTRDLIICCIIWYYWMTLARGFNVMSLFALFFLFSPVNHKLLHLFPLNDTFKSRVRHPSWISQICPNWTSSHAGWNLSFLTKPFSHFLTKMCWPTWWYHWWNSLHPGTNSIVIFTYPFLKRNTYIACSLSILNELTCRLGSVKAPWPSLIHC